MSILKKHNVNLGLSALLSLFNSIPIKNEIRYVGDKYKVLWNSDKKGTYIRAKHGPLPGHN